MNIYKKALLASAVSSALIACSDSGSIAGIGGSGYISSGAVTGFGSIFVNGVEFDTSSSSFDIEGISGNETDLVTGMRVTVVGTVDPNGITGTATSVSFEDQLEGPVSSACTANADDDTKSCTILGVTVLFSADDTTYVGTDYSALSVNDELQVSGFYDETGALIATAAVYKGTFISGDEVEIKGTVSALAGNTFTLTSGSSTLSIDTSSADLSNVPGGLADGQFVEVRANLIAVNDTSLNATIIELEDDALDGVDDAEIEGIITRFASLSDFDIDGIPVDASSAVLTPSGFTLTTGIKVEAEGSVDNGVLIAGELKLREGNIRAEATISSVDTSNLSFELTVFGQQKTVYIDESTRLDDKLQSDTIAQTLSNLDGQFVRVRGLDDGSGNIQATRVRTETPDDEIFQAVIGSQITNTSITLMGITIAIDGSTDFQDTDNNTIGGGHAAFISSTTDGVSVIKIKDKQAGSGGSNAVGTADEVELQAP